MAIFTLKLIAPPAVEPVSLAEARNHLRLDPDLTDDDAAILRMIKSARRWCESYRRETFVTATWRMGLPGFRGCEFPFEADSAAIQLPRGPLRGIDPGDVAYVAADGSNTSVDHNLYEVNTDAKPGRITPAYGTCWPSARCQAGTFPVSITFTAGYGDAGSDVPEEIRDAILLLVDHRYRKRGPVAVGTGDTVQEIPLTVKALLDSNRRVRVA